MNCIKCGREMAVGQVFCKECLAKMAQHPVKPDTPVLLPNRSGKTANRRSNHSRKIRKPEEQITRLRRLVLIQTLALLTILIGLAATIYIANKRLEESNETVLPGQNYSTVETTESK